MALGIHPTAIAHSVYNFETGKNTIRTGNGARGRAFRSIFRKFGVASWTASILTQGTTRRSAVDIANQLQSVGASVNAPSGWNSSNVSMQTLTRNLDLALRIFADVVMNPSFPAPEAEALRRRATIRLTQRISQPASVVGPAFYNVLYGDD